MTRALEAIKSFLAALGLMAVAGLVGLHFGGFFYFLAARHPGSAVLQFFFGSV